MVLWGASGAGNTTGGVGADERQCFLVPYPCIPTIEERSRALIEYVP